MQRTNIYLADTQVAALDKIATARGVSRAEVVRDLIDRGLSARESSFDADLAAIDQSFGALRDHDTSIDRRAGEREQHLDRVRALPASTDSDV